MNETAAIAASAITSDTLTVGTIHLGARPGTRTRLGSIVDCTRKSGFTQSHKDIKQKLTKDFFVPLALPFVPLCETAYSNIAFTTSSITSRDRLGLAACFFSTARLTRSSALAILLNLPSLTNASSTAAHLPA